MTTNLPELLLQVVEGRVHQEQPSHVRLAQIGPPAWAALHQWAETFAAQVGDSCGCGQVAIAVTNAFHDAVNRELGKEVRDPENLAKVAEWFGGVPLGQEMRRFVMYRPNIPPGSHDANQANRPSEPQFEGVVFSDGKTAIRWLTAKRSVAVWDSFDDMMAIHGHPEYGSKMHWLDGSPTHLAQPRKKHRRRMRVSGHVLETLPSVEDAVTELLKRRHLEMGQTLIRIVP